MPSTPTTPRPGRGGSWVGGLMLLGAALLFALLVAHLLRLALAGSDAVVPADGTAYALDLPAGEERMLFRRDGIIEVPDCLVGPPGGARHEPDPLWWSVRTDAQGGTWHAFGRFDTGDGRVVLECTAGLPLDVRVGLPVGFQDVFGPGGALVLGPLLLGAGGMVILVLAALRRSRPPGPDGRIS